MDARGPMALLFAFLFLVTVPAIVHASFEGAYKPEGLGGTFWIGPISTTLPYIFLALVFLAHCHDIGSKSQKRAYVGAIMAWMSMMAFTLYLVSQDPGNELSSTLGIAVGATPFFYIPLLALPYFAGVIAVRLWTSGGK